MLTDQPSKVYPGGAGGTSLLDARNSPPEADPLEFAPVLNFEHTIRKTDDTTVPEEPHDPTDVDRGQTERIGDVHLTQWKPVALVPGDAPCRNASREVQNQTGDPLFR